MSKTTKVRRRKPARIRNDGVPLYMVSVEMPGPLYETLVEEAERRYRSLTAHIIATLAGASDR